MGADDGLPTIFFSSSAEWEDWLEAEHRGPGVWIKVAKKASGIESVTTAEALDVALCFGWIDSRREALDEQYFLQRYTPRQPRGRWSRINREKVERLTAEGRMRASGLAEVDRAKADGRWDAAYDGQRTATVPDDLGASSKHGPPPRRSSRRSTARTATRSSTGSTTPRSRRRGHGGSRSSSPCSKPARRSTRSRPRRRA